MQTSAGQEGLFEVSMPRRPMAGNKLWLQPVWAQLDNLEAGHLPGITLGAPPQEPKFTPNLPTKCKSPCNEAVVVVAVVAVASS